MDYLDNDFFLIEDHDGHKFVHVMGYCYHGDSDENGKDYKGIEFTGVYIPIELFPDKYEEEYDWQVDCCTQYIFDFSQDECEFYMDHYYGESILCGKEDYGLQPISLQYRDITPESPTGFYTTAI